VAIGMLSYPPVLIRRPSRDGFAGHRRRTATRTAGPNFSASPVLFSALRVDGFLAYFQASACRGYVSL